MVRLVRRRLARGGGTRLLLLLLLLVVRRPVLLRFVRLLSVLSRCSQRRELLLLYRRLLLLLLSLVRLASATQQPDEQSNDILQQTHRIQRSQDRQVEDGRHIPTCVSRGLSFPAQLKLDCLLRQRKKEKKMDKIEAQIGNYDRNTFDRRAGG